MKIELCVSTGVALSLAAKYNFDRVELCQSLEVGGITPSIGYQQYALNLFSNTHVLIRCRAGNFVYTEQEKEMMISDISASVNLGVAGIVVGALQEDYTIDLKFLSEIREKFPKIEITFHRAFDDLRNPLEAIEQLISFRVKRILTSGGRPTVIEGIGQLSECIKIAQGRIEIMIGGGINENNIQFILNEISPNAIHFSGTILQEKGNQTLFEEKMLLANENKIKNILEMIRNH